MSKPTILMLYQDCYDCDANKAWHDEQLQKAKELKLRIIYVPHTLSEGKELIIKASSNGFKKLPVLTDMTKFSYDIADFAKTKKIKAKDGDTKKAK